jgi:hypothetical protein
MLSPGPLTEEEIKELDQFLLDAEGIEESMDISSVPTLFEQDQLLIENVLDVVRYGLCK